MPQAENEYDDIAEAYRNSKQLSFRKYLEEYSLFEMLGEVRGKSVLDLACGEGFYTRKIKQAGAAEVTGVDISTEMIRLAEKEEKDFPLGCRYVNRDVAELERAEPVDFVVAMYLLNYAKTKEELLRFCQVSYNVLRSAGRFVGVNDNVRNPPNGTVSFAKYGFEKECATPPKEGDVILYKLVNEDGKQFEFKNFYLAPETYQWAFQEAGFTDFKWVDLHLASIQQGNLFWDEFLSNPPLIGLMASKR